MQKPNINTARPVVPMIYAYTTPEVARHDGWTKIGYTEQDVETRIKQQTHTADIRWNLEWKGNATYDDGSADTFTDKDFHIYLRKLDVEQEVGVNNEWFHVTGPVSRGYFFDFRQNRGIVGTGETVIPYTLRSEQEDAVEKTCAYKNAHPDGEFLWNCKPRFGKTLSVYDFAKKIGAEKVLVVTNRPAIANSWFDDYARYLGNESGLLFVSEVDALKGRAGVLTRDEYSKLINGGASFGCIEFVSLQDLKGSVFFGGQYDKLEEVANIEWDLLVVDEAHEGVDTDKTDVAFERIHRKFTLHLSGTPFKALASAKFPDNAIYNWTYADEQKRKRDWDETSEEENPYAALPRLNLYTYQMSEIIRDELKQGVEINGETEEYAFDLNEFFSTQNGRFVYESSVDKFLDALTTQLKFPFSTEDLRQELKHTFWLLDRVDSAKALAKKLETHPVFSQYKVVLAAGDGKLDDDEETEKSFNKVTKAIAENDRTITLSVGQLTTGVTIPEWTAVLMLCNAKSSALYMQAAFRAQNPCLFKSASGFRRKENSYVFDFDPARTLTIFEKFANDLSSDTSAGRGDIETRKRHIRELLNFFPVIGEDENGELTELDAEQVLTIPRKIRSVEVVRRGFMSNFLFQNISQIFGAPKAVLDILDNLTPVKEQKAVPIPREEMENLSLDEDGEVKISEKVVIGKSAELFGDKIFGVSEVTVDDIRIEMEKTSGTSQTDRLKTFLKDKAKAQVKAVVETAGEAYGTDMKAGDKRQIESTLGREAERIVDKKVKDLQIEQNILEKKRDDELRSRHDTGKTVEEITKDFEEKSKELVQSFQEDIAATMQEFSKQSVRETVRTVETKVEERKKDTVEESIRDHLRGFSRTIPSFLMAYGDDTVTLATFDSVVPGNVFLEVTSITLEQFKFLRDGGKYTDDNGDEKEFAGQLFDSVVFDDSVKEFLALKQKLADYFDEKAIEDIFDYIPPQKTNQIYTPKDVVKRMVDMLEAENPGCFDMPDKTFIDLYMKSGLYIAEIVKRLYQSPAMQEAFPDGQERLKHIFEKQVYGLAPTEIIYQIALHFILGFSDDAKTMKHNLVQLDALPYAKEGTLQQKLDEIFGE